MEHPVFISYNRQTSSQFAQAIHDELGELAFLDTSDIEAGERFIRRVTESLLDSRVVVVLANDVYFSRWYCLRELRVARAIYDALLQRESSTEQQLNEALQHIVVALPSDSRPSGLTNLPPLLQQTNWPTADNASAVAAEARRRLSLSARPLRERLADSGASRIIEALREASALPPPGNCAGLRTYHRRGALPPSIGDRFAGRANDLELIHFELSTMRGAPAQSAALSVRIAATGGFGKTRVAIEYVWRYGPAYYPGGCFWIDADTDGPGIEDQLYGIWKALISPERVPELGRLRKEGQSVAQLLAESLARASKAQPILLVVDNIPEGGPGEHPRSMKQFCPAPGLVTVLATSRQKTVEDGTKMIALRVLPRSAALQLLTHDLDDAADLSDGEWEGVADWVGDLPLALDLLNRCLYLKALTPRELAKLSQTGSQSQELDSLAGAIAGQVPQDALRGVTQALLVSVQRLDESARQAARLLAQCAPTGIPMQLLQALGSVVDQPKIRATLSGRNFVTGGGGRAFGSMHRVVADFLRQTAGPDERTDFVTVCNAVFQVMTPERCRNPVEWPLMNALRPHALWLFERGLAFYPTDVETPLITWLGMVAAILLRGQGESQESLRIRRMVYEARSRVLGRDRPEVLSAQYHFATALQDVGDYVGARELIEDLLTRARRIERPGGHWTLTAIHALAGLESGLGNLEKAGELLQTVLAARNRIQSSWELARQLFHASSISEHEIHEIEADRLTCMANLAEVFHAQRKLQEARELQEQVLKARERLFIPDDVQTILAKLNLAATLKEMGDLSGAQELERSARTSARKTLPSEHFIVLEATDRLSKTLRLLGENQLAGIFEAEVQKSRAGHS